jgi:hypothetical protein
MSTKSEAGSWPWAFGDVSLSLGKLQRDPGVPRAK